MTEEEIKAVAEVLAKIGGNWYPERARSEPKLVSNRHREVARLIVAEVERLKVASLAATGSEPEHSPEARPASDPGSDELEVGASVLYRPPGDKRMLACRVERLDNGRAYVVPERREIGWVSTHSLLPLNPTRDSGPRLPLASIPVPSGESSEPELPAVQLTKQERRQRGEQPTAGVKYYYSSSGEWIAFRMSETDRYLFNKKGHWIGWFPWNDNDVVGIHGQYVGTVFYGNRIFRKEKPDADKRDPGFVMDPGNAEYVSHPGHAAPYRAPHGYKDLDMGLIPSSTRTWLKNRTQSAASRSPSAFERWMSTIGLGGVARAIESMIRPGAGR